MNESAVSDAQRNALINGVKNCRFVCGKVRLIFPSGSFYYCIAIITTMMSSCSVPLTPYSLYLPQ